MVLYLQILVYCEVSASLGKNAMQNFKLKVIYMISPRLHDFRRLVGLACLQSLVHF